MVDDTTALLVEAIVDLEPDPLLQAILDEPRKCPACGGTDHLRRSSKNSLTIKGGLQKGAITMVVKMFPRLWTLPLV